MMLAEAVHLKPGGLGHLHLFDYLTQSLAVTDRLTVRGDGLGEAGDSQFHTTNNAYQTGSLPLYPSRTGSHQHHGAETDTYSGIGQVSDRGESMTPGSIGARGHLIGCTGNTTVTVRRS